MKFFATTVFAAAFALVTMSAKAGVTAPAGDATMPFMHGSYFILEGGANFTAPTDTYNAFISRNQRAYLKTGFAVSMAGGYKWSNGIRTELEFSYHNNHFNYFDTPANPYTGRQDTVGFMANAIYDIKTGSRFTPFIGGGVGGTMAWFKKIRQVNFNITAFYNPYSTRFAYQGIAGVAIAVAPQWEALIDFHYRVSNDHTFTQLNVLGTFNSRTNYNIHDKTVMAGLRYAF